MTSHLLAPLELGQLLLATFVVVTALSVGHLAVDAAPARNQHHLPAGAEHVRASRLGPGGAHRRFDAGVLEHRLGVENGQEPAHHQVVDPQVVLVHLVDRVTLGAGGDDRVVVGDLGVVDDAAEGQQIEAEDVPRGCGVFAAFADQRGDRLDLGDHVLGQVARVGPGVGQRLVLLVQSLGGAQGAAGGEAVAAVGVALERGEVIQQRRALLALGLLELGDGADPACAVGDDRLGLGGGLQAWVGPRVVPALVDPRSVLNRVEDGVHGPVGLGLERLDLGLAAGQNRQRRRLHPPERHGPVKRGAQADRRRSSGVHADDPVGLRARPRGRLERGQLGGRAQLRERRSDRLLGHRVQPQPLHGLVRAGLLVQVGEDQLAFPPGVAGVDDQVHVVAAELTLDHVHLLLGPLIPDDELEALGDDRQIGHAPFLELVVVFVRVSELDEMADGPRDDVIRALEIALRFGECARQNAHQVAPNRWLLCDDERLGHESGEGSANRKRARNCASVDSARSGRAQLRGPPRDRGQLQLLRGPRRRLDQLPAPRARGRARCA